MRKLACIIAFTAAIAVVLTIYRSLSNEPLQVADRRAFTNKTIDEQIATFTEPERLDRELASVDVEISVAPTAKLMHKRGVLLTFKREYLAAITAFDAAIKLDPEDATAYYNRGTVKAQLGDSESAISDYTSAIAADSNYSLAYSNRGMEFVRLEDFDAALRDLRIAVQKDPNDHPAIHAMAIVYLERNAKQAGDLIEAKRLAEAACNLTNYEYQLYVETLRQIEGLLRNRHDLQ